MAIPERTPSDGVDVDLCSSDSEMSRGASVHDSDTHCLQSKRRQACGSQLLHSITPVRASWGCLRCAVPRQQVVRR